MTISAIVAVEENNAIGRDNQLPWHLPEDLKFFKRTTMGWPVVMGRKTYDSMGKPLKGRLNVVLTKQEELSLPEGVRVENDLQNALKKLEEENIEEVFIIGGGKVFEQAMLLIDQLYLTVVKTTIRDADVFFPHIDHSHWKLTWEEEHKADEKHAYDYTFRRYERINL
jgi:dihydrofolate reductase